MSLVMPARNEAGNISWVFEQIPVCVEEVILGGGGTSDATVLMTWQRLPTFQHVRQSGLSKGKVLRTGFREASGNFVVMEDVDGCMSRAGIPHFLENSFDVVKGSGFIEDGGSLDITAPNKRSAS